MSVYVISSYVDIASISKHFPTKKIAAKYFLHYLVFNTNFTEKMALRSSNILVLQRFFQNI